MERQTNGDMLEQQAETGRGVAKSNRAFDKHTKLASEAILHKTKKVSQNKNAYQHCVAPVLSDTKLYCSVLTVRLKKKQQHFTSSEN